MLAIVRLQFSCKKGQESSWQCNLRSCYELVIVGDDFVKKRVARSSRGLLGDLKGAMTKAGHFSVKCESEANGLISSNKDISPNHSRSYGVSIT
jgi:hypothetical protein